MNWPTFFQDPQNIQSLGLSVGRFVAGCAASFGAAERLHANDVAGAMTLFGVAAAAFGFQVNDPRHVAGIVQTALYTPPPQKD